MPVVPIPQPSGYRVPRSYVGQIWLDVATTGGVTFTGSQFLFQDVILVDWVLNIRNSVWNWNSNVYTPDWIIDSNTSNTTRFGLPIVDGFYAEVRMDLNERLRYIWIQPGGLPGTVYKYDLPPAPPTYWLPSAH
jgi:hypothetical protein